MTIDIFKFEKVKSMWTISRATADFLRDTGGTIGELCDFQTY